MFSFRPIDLSVDTEIIIKYRKDSYKISFGDESMFGNKEDYLKKINETDKVSGRVSNRRKRWCTHWPN
ncbi:hypothetical protein WAK64_20175 [Bacillus spongiae]|uniref:Uncharacterized protein n=1 Tax=Bacillus spongiae TaxID=2683610 RepID=A0ABU8HJL8_9BACI